ncbi:anaerobic ribonucleoside-triphosphate reductase [Ureaplasma ceti]|uniref:Anaerobic ribonucleoside triphosphate reductase n=1 Tax=Ureaplasma ceti TaxID=3119530 RepID=A0ABP9U4M3_9BACT
MNTKRNRTIQDNAADRQSYVGILNKKGEQAYKKDILASLPTELANLHKEGYIHIHDLDAYGLTYNCLGFNLLQGFPYNSIKNLRCDAEKIIKTFDFLKELFEKMGNEQSGGMSLINFDIDLAQIFQKVGVTAYQENTIIFESCISSMINWCNDMHTRMGKTSYYITLNVGLGTDDFSRFLTKTLLQEFKTSRNDVYKPNIVFKVKKGINLEPDTINHDLLKEALKTTAIKMIPTYLFCDCEEDAPYDPYTLGIIGCRSRIMSNIFREEQGCIGRGNLANISMNIVKLALQTDKECSGCSISDKVKVFVEKLRSLMDKTTEILLDRFDKTINLGTNYFPTIAEFPIMMQDIKETGVQENLKQFSLSLGYIGLSETVEILTGSKFWNNDQDTYKIAYDIVKTMREQVDSYTEKYHINFSLLATAGELISGRFLECDKQSFNHPVFEKGFYTNSFHVNVDSLLPAFKKIQLEAPFHTLSNGGSITYVELKEAPLNNWLALYDLIKFTAITEVHYLGFNFPLDICNDCNTKGIFDSCSNCSSKNIKRIRRVSGYLEIQDGFTSGKYNESLLRKVNK